MDSTLIVIENHSYFAVFEYGEYKTFFIFSYKEVSENHVKITFYVRIVQNNPISIEKHSYFAVLKFGEYGESTFFAIFNQIRGIILIRYHFCTLK